MATEEYPKYKPGKTTSTSFVSPGPSAYQAPPTSMTSARGAYTAPPTSMTSARGAYTAPSPSMLSAGQGGVKPVLDAAVAKIMGGTDFAPHQYGQQAPGNLQAAKQTEARRQQESALQGLYDQMYETVGGPNAALLASLQAQKDQYLADYTQNKADVENLYGTLTEDITQYGADLQTRYDTTMGQMSDAQTAYQQGITDTQATQAANRAAAAAELGLSAESLQAAPSTALSEIAATSGAAAENWANLFSANKLFEQASTGRQVAGAEGSKSNQLLAMKRYLDQQNMMIDQQIAAEKSKTATQQLTDVGKALREAQIDQTLKYAQGLAPGIFGSPEAQQTDLMSGFSDAKTNLKQITGVDYNIDDLRSMLYDAQSRMQDQKIFGASEDNQLLPEHITLLNSLGLSAWNITG